MKTALQKIFNFFRVKFFHSSVFWIVLSGALTSLTLYSNKLFLLAWVSVAPLCYFLLDRRESVIKCYFLMLLWALVYYFMLYTWFFSLYPLDIMGFTKAESVEVVIIIWCAVSVAQSLQMSLVGLVYGLIKPKGVSAPLVLGLLWVILEWAQGYGALAMNWGRLALSQYNFAPAVQSASLFGSLFVTFLIVCINGLIALYLWTRVNLKTSAKSLYLAAAVIFLANICFGAARMLAINAQIKKAPIVPIAAVQADFASEEKWDARPDEIFDAYYKITLEAVNAGAKVIVWPETTIPIPLERSGYYSQLKNLAEENQLVFIIGSIYEKDDNVFNALYCIDCAKDRQLYFKRRLVPFGEFVPFEKFLSKFKIFQKFNLFDQMMTSGKEAVAFDTSYGKFSGLICFDSIIQRYGVESVKKGAQALFIATNDSWYIDSASIRQHYGHAVLRAVENNRFVVRAANAGVSGVISSAGTTLKSLKTRQDGYVLYNVPLINRKTLYTLMGDFIAYIAIACAVEAFIYFRFLEKLKNRAKEAAQEIY